MNEHINVRKNYIESKRQIMLEIVYIIHVCLYICQELLPCNRAEFGLRIFGL